MIDWTNEHAKAWADTWEQSHMKRGLEMLKMLAKFAPLEKQGQDAITHAALQYSVKEGQQSVLTLIEALKDERRIKKELPPPFTREARGEEPQP